MTKLQFITRLFSIFYLSEKKKKRKLPFILSQRWYPITQKFHMKKEIGHSYPIFHLELLINSWTWAVNTFYLSANYLKRLTNIQ